MDTSAGAGRGTAPSESGDEPSVRVLPASQLRGVLCTCGIDAPAGSWPTGLEICVPAGRRLESQTSGREDRLYYVHSGRLSIGTEGGSLAAGPDDFVVIQAGLTHHLSSAGDQPARLILVLFRHAHHHFVGASPH